MRRSLETGGEAREALRGVAGERGVVLSRRVFVERDRIGGPDLGQALGTSVEDELVVGISLLCVLARGRVVGALGLRCFSNQFCLFGSEEFELTADQVGEAAPAESQRSSR